MKTISLWQPHASAIPLDLKRFETRDWQTHYRGPLAIHASKQIPADVAHAFSIADTAYRAILDACGVSLYSLPRGAVIATCTLERIVPTATRECDALLAGRGAAERTERLLGDYSPGRFAWVLTDIHPLLEPIPARGFPGIWEWTPPANLQLP